MQSYPPMRMVRFTERYLRQGVENHIIAGREVPIYSVPKTLADLFRNSKLVDRSIGRSVDRSIGRSVDRSIGRSP